MPGAETITLHQFASTESSSTRQSSGAAHEFNIQLNAMSFIVRYHRLPTTTVVYTTVVIAVVLRISSISIAVYLPLTWKRSHNCCRFSSKHPKHDWIISNIQNSHNIILVCLLCAHTGACVAAVAIFRSFSAFPFHSKECIQFNLCFL